MMIFNEKKDCIGRLLCAEQVHDPNGRTSYGFNLKDLKRSKIISTFTSKDA